MQYQKTFSLALFGLWLTSCSSYDHAPLTPTHPAHSDAPSGAAGQPSMTLAYASLNMPPFTPPPVTVQDKGGHGAPHGSVGSAQQLATGEGKVIAVVPGSSQLVLEHGPIKGFMDAMTMGYQTEPKSLLDGIKAGDKIRFAIDTEKKSIVKLEKIP